MEIFQPTTALYISVDRCLFNQHHSIIHFNILFNFYNTFACFVIVKQILLLLCASTFFGSTLHYYRFQFYIFTLLAYGICNWINWYTRIANSTGRCKLLSVGNWMQSETIHSANIWNTVSNFFSNYISMFMWKIVTISVLIYKYLYTVSYMNAIKFKALDPARNSRRCYWLLTFMYLIHYSYILS